MDDMSPIPLTEQKKMWSQILQILTFYSEGLAPPVSHPPTFQMQDLFSISQSASREQSTSRLVILFIY